MKRDTRILRAGSEPEANFGILNPPVYHASTIAASSFEDRKYRADNRYEEGVFAYGLDGTPTQTAFEKAVACLEGAERSIALPTGLASVTRYGSGISPDRRVFSPSFWKSLYPWP